MSNGFEVVLWIAAICLGSVILISVVLVASAFHYKKQRSHHRHITPSDDRHSTMPWHVMNNHHDSSGHHNDHSCDSSSSDSSSCDSGSSSDSS